MTNPRLLETDKIKIPTVPCKNTFWLTSLKKESTTVPSRHIRYFRDLSTPLKVQTVRVHVTRKHASNLLTRSNLQAPFNPCHSLAFRTIPNLMEQHNLPWQMNHDTVEDGAADMSRLLSLLVKVISPRS